MCVTKTEQCSECIIMQPFNIVLYFDPVSKVRNVEVLLAVQVKSTYHFGT